MHRRRWLQIGLGAAALLAVGGGAVAFIDPGWRGGRLTEGGRQVFRHLSRGLLDGTLPVGAPQASTLDALLARIEELVAALPAHAQQELSQLLALLGTAPGRRLLAGLEPGWPEATVPQIQAALQDMRSSPSVLRQQAYHALHDIVGAAYFSDAGTWAQLGYPGPMDL